MQDCLTYDEIVDYIYSIPKFTKKGGISQTREMMALIGNPQESFKYIHVAGTNGKGSVSAMLDCCLRSCERKTGLFTSPHLVCINERIRVDGQMISDEDFVQLFHSIKAKIDAHMAKGGVHPTFFEFMYMMAMAWFKMQGVEYAVVETGLGGRLDATNVIEQPEITVITSIGFDHMQFLGTSITDIAGEKAGIVKKGCPLVFDATGDEASEVIMARVKEVNGEAQTEIVPIDEKNILNAKYPEDGIQYTLKSLDDACEVFVPMLGSYQITNSAVAVTAMKLLGKKNDYFGVTKEYFTQKMLAGIADTHWEGRMEKVGENLYIDGAHNDDGICALVHTLNQRFSEKNLFLLFAVAEDKDYTSMIEHLCTLKNLKGVVVTVLANERRTDADIVTDLFEKNGHALVRQAYNIKEALDMAVAWTGSDVLCCCGSLYLAGSIKEMLEKE